MEAEAENRTLRFFPPTTHILRGASGRPTEGFIREDLHTGSTVTSGVRDRGAALGTAFAFRINVDS